MARPSFSVWLLKTLHIVFVCMVFNVFGNTSLHVDFSSGQPIFDESVIRTICQENPVLVACSYEPDISSDMSELSYLLGVSVGQCINTNDFVSFFNRLSYKKKWQTALLYLRLSNDKTTLEVRCALKAFWTINTVEVRGVWRGAYDYRACYGIDPGDRFDRAQHEMSVKKIKRLLHDEGHCGAELHDEIIHDPISKTVSVILHIKQGDFFKVGSVIVDIREDHVCNKRDAKYLKEHIESQFLQRLKEKRYTRALVDSCGKTIKRYLAHEGYAHHKITLRQHMHHATGIIDFHVHIRMYTKRVFLFRGNSFFSNEELLDKLALYSHSFWMLPAALLAQEIIQWYRNQGFLDTTVEAKDEQCRSSFNIKEGKRAVITRLDLQGISTFGQTKIKRFFKTICNKPAITGAIQEALQQVCFLYEREGYVDMRIEEHAIEYDAQNDTHVLMVRIHEGSRYLINRVEVPGYQSQEMSLQPRTPIPFCAGYVNKQRLCLERKLLSSGYRVIRLTPEMHTKTDNNVTLVWQVHLADENTVFGKTIICGSSKVPFRYLRNALAYQENEVWEQEKVTATVRRLCDLDVFKHVFLHATHTDTTKAKTMILTVQDEDSYEVRVRAGVELENVQHYSSFAGMAYKVGGSFFAKNPLGALDVCKFDASITPSHREIVARYVYPYPWNAPVDLIGQAYSIRHEQPGFMGSTLNIYTVYQNGFLLGIRHQAQAWDTEGTCGLEWMKTTITDHECARRVSKAIHFSPRLLDIFVPYFFVEQSCMVDYLDERSDPSNGSFTLCTIKTMIPLSKEGKESFFVRFLCDYSRFIPFRFFVAAFRIRFGHIFYKTFDNIMPTERYYLGGSRSLRGYDTDSVPPLGCFKDESGHTQWVPQGGKTMFNINAELRIPLLDTLSGVLFQDMGVLSGDRWADLRVTDIHAATGFGFRYKTPLGPLRFDIGFKWSQEVCQERSYAWFLTFGHAF